MSASTIVGAHWDAEAAAVALGFDPDDLSELAYLNEAYWLHAGETEHASEIKTVDFESEGDGKESQFLIIPDQGSIVYLQCQAFCALLSGDPDMLLVHAAANDWQIAGELEDFEPDLANWKLRATA